MVETLFNPVRFEIPEKIILIPHFPDRKYFSVLKNNVLKTFSIFNSTILVNESYSIITDFIGYTHMLTILEFINNVRKKEVFFLGTAGSLNPAFNSPKAVVINKIDPSAIFNHFCNKKSFELFKTGVEKFKSVNGVSVDIVQRETLDWLNEQRSKRTDIVEMEIYPLRDYLKKDFYAFVVLTDLITEKGVNVFKDRKKVGSEFKRAFEQILELIDEKQNNIN